MFKPDTIALVKSDGRRFENIKADVQPDTVFIDDGSLPLEEGDTILRELPNGLEESYIVVDRGYFSGGLSGSSGEYQAKVQKKTTPDSHLSEKIVYSVRGENARVNINSIDSSVNIVSVEEKQLFANLRQVIQDEIHGEEKEELLKRLSQVERSEGESNFSESYAKFMALAALTMLLCFRRFSRPSHNY